MLYSLEKKLVIEMNKLTSSLGNKKELMLNLT